MASTAALVIVLSVFNGMQDLIISNFNRFNPPLKIEIKEGKVFALENEQFSIFDLENVTGIKAVEQVVSDLVLITYQDKQILATLFGISENYSGLSGLADMTIDGHFGVDVPNSIVFGAGVAGLLGIDLNDYAPVKLYYPKRSKQNFLNPIDAFHTCYAHPVGVFATYTPYDANALFVSQKLAKEIFDYDTEISFIAIYLNDDAKREKIQQDISQIVGNDFTVQNQMQQEALLFKTIQGENLIVFLILGFIFVIATFNIIGVLNIIIIEKKQDISVLHTFGATKSLLKNIFLSMGAMIGTVGGFFGMCIGLVCCLIQQYFGVISFGGPDSSYVISAYPVAINPAHFIVIFFLVLIISFLSSWISLREINGNYLINKY